MTAIKDKHVEKLGKNSTETPLYKNEMLPKDTKCNSCNLITS